MTMPSVLIVQGVIPSAICKAMPNIFFLVVIYVLLLMEKHSFQMQDFFVVICVSFLMRIIVLRIIPSRCKISYIPCTIASLMICLQFMNLGSLLNETINSYDFSFELLAKRLVSNLTKCILCFRLHSCDERIQKIQTIKMMDGIFICAAPHCLKSFLKKTEFESHIHGTHADLLQRNIEKEDGGNDSEAASARQPTPSESTARAPPRQVFSPRDPQPREPPLPRPIMQPKQQTSSFFGQVQNQSETPFPDYPPMHGHPPPTFAVPINSNPVVGPPPFGYSPFPPEGGLQFYSSPYEIARPDSAPEVGAEQGSLLGFPPGQAVGANFSDGFPRPWIMGPTGQGMVDGFQVRPVFFPGDYGPNMGVLASNMVPPSSTNKVVEQVQGGSGVDPRDGKGILAPQPLPFPPLPPPPGPHHLLQPNRDKSYSDHDMGRDGREFGWQHELHENFGSGQD